MTYDTRKAIYGQEYVQEVEIVCDACKYSIAPYIDDDDLVTDNVSTISDSATGALALSGVGTTWPTTWGSSGTKYGRTEWNEILSFTVTSYSSITLTGRALFGTIGHTIALGTTITIIHQGEADGSCRGYPFSCSNTDSFSATAKRSLIYCSAQRTGGALRFAGLKKVSHESGEIDPGETIGTRARLKVQISNQIHNDYGIVPYPDKRTSHGTMFGKLLARHPYFQGRKVIFREGFRNSGSFSEPDFIEREFIIDSVNLSKDVFSIDALDPIILTEDKKAKMPTPSPATLSTTVTTGATVFEYINADDYYFGAMSATIYVRIDSEVIKCQVTDTKELTSINRGVRSEEKNHDIGATIQDCVAFELIHGIDAITYALENFTTIDAAYIDDYSAVITSLPALILTETIISKPTAVSEFINDVVKLGNLVTYFNEDTKKIVIGYTPEITIESITISAEVDIKGVDIDENIKNQNTRFSYLMAPTDITKDSDDNFSIRLSSVNLSLESAEYIGQINEKKTVKSIFLTNSSDDITLGNAYVNRVMDSNLIAPKIINCVIDASKVGVVGSAELTLGSIVNISTSYNEDIDGNPISDLYQVLKLSGDAYKGFAAKLRRYQSIAPEDIDYTISAGTYLNYDLADFYTPAAGNYTIYIESGVIFGSYDTSLPAFTTGTQTSGVTFTIINRGKWYSPGGNGGDSGIYAVFTNATDGTDGGITFNATVDCVIDNGAGLIWAGGGGGGGEFETESFSPGIGYFWSYASGGGGGQGYGVSLGGIGTTGGSTETSTPTYDVTADGGNMTVRGPYGGLWGEPGGSPGGLGGLAGIAIKSNGNTVTLSSGDNILNVKGRRT